MLPLKANFCFVQIWSDIGIGFFWKQDAAPEWGFARIQEWKVGIVRGRFLRKSDYIVFTSVSFFICFFIYLFFYLFFVCSPYNFWKLASILTKLYGYGPWVKPPDEFKNGICRSHGLAAILDFVKNTFWAILTSFLDESWPSWSML